MIWKSITALAPFLGLIIGLVCMVVTVFIWRRAVRRLQWESPLNRKLLRPPGYSLQLKIDELDEKLTAYFVCFLLFPVLGFSFHISHSYFGGEPESAFRTFMAVSLWAIVISILVFRLSRLLSERKNYIQGLDGEMFTGAELNLLMLDGCRVFHDIQFQDANIDHVVVSQSGVFSVNTKTWSKAKKGDGKADAVVDHQTNVIKFAGWSRPIPINQLEGEARWLSESLTSSVGKKVVVEPILALPGWFVKNGVVPGKICVLNPFNKKNFFVTSRKIYSPQDLQQIAHSLEQLCRDVKPSFREKKGWGE